jgi:hypothetical protein
MLRAAVFLSTSAVATAQGFNVGPTILKRNIEGEGHTEYIRTPYANTSGCTNTYASIATVKVIELTTDGVDDVSDNAWSTAGSYVPATLNPVLCANPAAMAMAVSCGVLKATELCSPTPCKGSAEKVGDPCCYGTDILNPATGAAARRGCTIVTNNEKAMCPTGTLNEMTEINKGDLCIVLGKGSSCGPWASTAGYDEGDESTGLCEETIFDIPIVLFFAICLIALLIIFVQCAFMGLFDLLCVKKENYEVRAMAKCSQSTWLAACLWGRGGGQ